MGGLHQLYLISISCRIMISGVRYQPSEQKFLFLAYLSVYSRNFVTKFYKHRRTKHIQFFSRIRLIANSNFRFRNNYIFADPPAPRHCKYKL
jgi:hypothetical protein